MKRGRAYDDRRLNWRDPDMPVIRMAKELDIYGFVVNLVALVIEPEEVALISQEDLATADPEEHPEWHKDPSYEWGEAGRRRKAARLRSYR